MRLVLSSLLISGLVFAQGVAIFEKAPPNVDEALRAKILYFYGSQAEGKFRQAENVVHEDSRDIYYGADKNKWEDFQIVSITYEENYTKAKVTSSVKDYIFLPGKGRTPFKRPLASTWKIDKGEWWWYVTPFDPKVGRETPWGASKVGAAGVADPKVQVEAVLSDPTALQRKLQSAVKASREDVQLSVVRPSSEEVTLTNEFDSAVTLTLQPLDMPGLEVKLDRTRVEPRESAKVTVRYTPDTAVKKPDIDARILVEPTAQVILLRITFAHPPAPQGPQPAAPKQ